LEHHPHIHALVPGGGPSLCGSRWIRTQHPLHRRRRKPFLVDNQELGHRFRDKFVAGLKNLHRRGQLRLSEHSTVCSVQSFDAWVNGIAAQDWNVFIAGPPKENASPQHLSKYLARYLSGGPISNRRLISYDDGVVTFWARSKNKRKGNRSQPFPLSGSEFVRRWSLHILPQGFTKSRRYGGFSPVHCKSYLASCRSLLKVQTEDDDPHEDSAPEAHATAPQRPCPLCNGPMPCILTRRRASWRVLLSDPSTCPWWFGFSLGPAASRPPPDD
jgi:hypothetical protein